MSLGAAYAYWRQAHSKPEAQTLASRLNLDLPRGTVYGLIDGMMYPMRRLIIAGEDTPANMAILFGPTWKADTAEIHRQTRLEVLLAAPPGSPSHTLGSALDQDYTGPRRPREASEDERETIARVRRL